MLGLDTKNIGDRILELEAVNANLQKQFDVIMLENLNLYNELEQTRKSLQKIELSAKQALN